MPKMVYKVYEMDPKSLYFCFSHKNNIYKHFLQHHGRKGNADDVDTIKYNYNNNQTVSYH